MLFFFCQPLAVMTTNNNYKYICGGSSVNVCFKDF